MELGVFRLQQGLASQMWEGALGALESCVHRIVVNVPAESLARSMCVWRMSVQAELHRSNALSVLAQWGASQVMLCSLHEWHESVRRMGMELGALGVQEELASQMWRMHLDAIQRCIQDAAVFAPLYTLEQSW